MNREEYIGKILIAGFSYYDASDNFIDQKQYHGTIIDVDDTKGILFRDEQSQGEHVIPPRLNALFPAPPGLYKAHTTGAIIENPDFISLWHVKKLPGENDQWEWQPCKADLKIKKSHSDNTEGASGHRRQESPCERRKTR